MIYVWDARAARFGHVSPKPRRPATMKLTLIDWCPSPRLFVARTEDVAEEVRTVQSSSRSRARSTAWRRRLTPSLR